jgi:hypothetical protein
MNDYQLDIAEIFRRFHISELGLSEGEACKRLGQYGPNRLAEEEAIRWRSTSGSEEDERAIDIIRPNKKRQSRVISAYWKPMNSPGFFLLQTLS